MIFKKNLFFLLLLVITWISCENSSEKDIGKQPMVQDTASYGRETAILPKLSKSASKTVANWLAYNDFENEATSLHQLSLEDLKERTSKLLAHTDSLQSNIPDTLNTKAINSRLIIVRTRTKLLQQEANKGVVVPENIELNISEVHTAVNNFIIQVNEKFQKDGIDLARLENEKKELEKQKQFLDSVYKAELNDQKNK